MFTGVRGMSLARQYDRRPHAQSIIDQRKRKGSVSRAAGVVYAYVWQAEHEVHLVLFEVVRGQELCPHYVYFAILNTITPGIAKG